MGALGTVPNPGVGTEPLRGWPHWQCDALTSLLSLGFCYGLTSRGDVPIPLALLLLGTSQAFGRLWDKRHRRGAACLMHPCTPQPLRWHHLAAGSEGAVPAAVQCLQWGRASSGAVPAVGQCLSTPHPFEMGTSEPWDTQGHPLGRVQQGRGHAGTRNQCQFLATRRGVPHPSSSPRTGFALRHSCRLQMLQGCREAGCSARSCSLLRLQLLLETLCTLSSSKIISVLQPETDPGPGPGGLPMPEPPRRAGWVQCRAPARSPSARSPQPSSAWKRQCVSDLLTRSVPSISPLANAVRHPPADLSEANGVRKNSW